MRITPILAQTNVNNYGKANKAGAAYSSSFMSGDKLQISDAAQSFAQIYKAAQKSVSVQTPDYYAKVQSIHERIKDGTYTVDSRDVAQSIIDDLV